MLGSAAAVAIGGENNINNDSDDDDDGGGGGGGGGEGGGGVGGVASDRPRPVNDIALYRTLARDLHAGAFPLLASSPSQSSVGLSIGNVHTAAAAVVAAVQLLVGYAHQRSP